MSQETMQLGYSLPTDFHSIIESNRAKREAQETAQRQATEQARQKVSAAREMLTPTLTAVEFIQAGNRATTPAEEQALIIGFTGFYSLAEAHGVQLDNARRTALSMLRPVPEATERRQRPVRGDNGAIAQLVREGKNLQARLAKRDEFGYSDEVVASMRRQLVDIENALHHYAS